MLSTAAGKRCRWILTARGAVYRCLTTSSVKRLKSLAQLPGPKAWPLVGNIPDLIKHMSKAGEESVYHQWHLKYGPIYRMKGAGNQLTVCISDPESAEALFRAEGQYPSRHIVEKNITWIHNKNNLPGSMFFSYGPEWKRIRSAAAKQVVPRRVGNFTTPLNEINDELLQYVARIRNKDGYVENIGSVLDMWAFQGVAYFVFREHLNVYDDTDPLVKEFKEAAQFLASTHAKIFISLPLYKIFPTKPYRNYLNGLSGVYTVGRKLMKKKYESIKEAIETGTVDETKTFGLMEQWLIEGKFTEKEALMLSCDMLTAGIETTANTSKFLLHEVARNPELQDKLYHEITTVLGERAYPTFDDLQKMTLVRNSVKETLRMYSATPGLIRLTGHSAEMNGYHIPAETSVLFSLYTAARSPEYVEEPNAFKPERWNRESSKLNAFISLPFGFGSRSCYGRRLAELELHLLLSRMVVHFKMSTDQQNLKSYQAAVQKPAEPVRIKLEERLQ